MIPTHGGRIETRIFVILFVGVPWTLLVTPFLPAARGNLGRWEVAKDLYPATFLALAVVMVLGVVVWDSIYHFLQQYRWEKDWPVMFAFFEVINEAILAWFVFKWLLPDSVTTAVKATFVVHVVSTWIVMWLFVLGPIKTLFIRWRFNGGHVIFWRGQFANKKAASNRKV